MSSTFLEPPSTFRISRIPPEIVELIVGFVRSRSTLAACALVGSDFLHASQQRLFTDVVFSPPKRSGARLENTTPARRFIDTLNSSPHIASFVRTVVIECEDSVQDQPWLYHDNALQFILPRLNRLAKISVNGKVKSGDETAPPKANLSWSSLSATLRAALTLIMCSGSVSDLELGGFSRIPVSSVIQSCSQLKKLSLLPLYVVDEEEMDPYDTVPRQSNTMLSHVQTESCLEEITIKQSSIALRRTADWLLRPGFGPNILNVERFRFTVANNADHYYVANIIDACAGSLKELEINPGSEIAFVRNLLRSSSPVGPPLSPLTLANLRQLRSLKVNTEIQMYKLNSNRYSDPIPWVVSLLSTLPHRNAFSTFELSLGLNANQQILESISWVKLVSLLGSDRFPHFECLILTLSPPATKDNDEEESQRLPSWVKDVLKINGQLSYLREKGMLTIQL